MNRNGYETELVAAKVAVEEAKENRFVTELEDKSSQVGKKIMVLIVPNLLYGIYSINGNGCLR